MNQWARVDGRSVWYAGEYYMTTTAPYQSSCYSDRSMQRRRTKLRRLAGAIQGRTDNGLYRR